MRTIFHEPTIEFAPIRDIPGLSIRNFRDFADFNAIEQLLDTSRKAGGIEETRTANDISAFYNLVKHFNLAQDLCLVEYHDELIAFTGTRWWEECGKNFT